MNQVHLFINGKSCPAIDNGAFDHISPITGRVITTAAAGKAVDVNKAIDAAAKAFPIWSALPPSEKRLRLLKAADLLAARAEDFIEIGISDGIVVEVLSGITAEDEIKVWNKLEPKDKDESED